MYEFQQKKLRRNLSRAERCYMQVPMTSLAPQARLTSPVHSTPSPLSHSMYLPLALRYVSVGMQAEDVRLLVRGQAIDVVDEGIVCPLEGRNGCWGGTGKGREGSVQGGRGAGTTSGKEWLCGARHPFQLGTYINWRSTWRWSRSYLARSASCLHCLVYIRGCLFIM